MIIVNSVCVCVYCIRMSLHCVNVHYTHNIIVLLLTLQISFAKPCSI